MRLGRMLACGVLTGIMVLAACGDDGDDGNDEGGDGDSSGGGGGKGEGGTTTCGLQTCESGQYCSNMICLDGCLSDKNCASNQTCEDMNEDTHVGTCRNKPQQATKDCDAFCDKAEACFLEGNDVNAANCMQACKAASAACVSCVNDSNCGQGCDDVCGDSGFGG